MGGDENYLRIQQIPGETLDQGQEEYALQDKLKEVERKANWATYRGKSDGTTIRILENRLDKVMIKYNEAQSIQQTYDQVVKRLRRTGSAKTIGGCHRKLSSRKRTRFLRTSSPGP